MSQFAQKLALWSVVILLLLIGVFLQVRSARGQMPGDPLATPSKSLILIHRF
jgi:hypothetical protein